MSRKTLSWLMLLVALAVIPVLAQEAGPEKSPGTAVAAKAATDAAAAVIEAPEDIVPPGRLVTLDASQSVGTIFLWSANEPYPAPVENWQIDSSAEKVYFATPMAPGKYAWTLAVILPDAANDADKGDQTQVVVVVGEAPPPPPPPNLAIRLSKSTISEADDGGATAGTVTRESVSEEDLPVMLTSSDPTTVRVSPLVTIPAGKTSVGFLVDAIDDDEENGTRVVTITAEAQGYDPVSVDLTVIDDEVPPIVLTLIADPTTFREDATSAAVIRREGDTTEALVIKLVSSDTTEATVPESVTIPAGETTAVFDITGVKDKEIDGDQKVTVTATCEEGCDPVSVELTVTDIDEEVVVELLFGIVVYESDQKDEYGPKKAQVINAKRLDDVDERFTWLPFDKDQVDEDGNVPTEPVDFRPWKEMLLQEGLEMPYVFFVQQEGKLVDQMPLPDTVDEVITKVNEHLP